MRTVAAHDVPHVHTWLATVAAPLRVRAVQLQLRFVVQIVDRRLEERSLTTRLASGATTEVWAIERASNKVSFLCFPFKLFLSTGN